MRFFVTALLLFALTSAHFLCEHCFVQFHSVQQEVAQGEKSVKLHTETQHEGKEHEHCKDCLNCCCIFVDEVGAEMRVLEREGEISVSRSFAVRTFTTELFHPPRA